MKLFQILRSKRKAVHLTQDDVAKKLHVSHQAVSNWENNKTIPSLDFIKLLSQLYCCSADDFLILEKENNLNQFSNNSFENFQLSRKYSEATIEMRKNSEPSSSKKIDIYRATDPRIDIDISNVPLDTGYFCNLPKNLVFQGKNISLRLRSKYNSHSVRLKKSELDQSSQIDRVELIGTTVENLKISKHLGIPSPIIKVNLLSRACDLFCEFMRKQRDFSKIAMMIDPLRVQVFLETDKGHSAVKLETKILDTCALSVINNKI
ncbi:helix-turn-helix transcriptional regulator [Lentilactobacillus raoultii]|uniref:Helix-turn-helix transcriptional regulator n=1 Tax=Lentilactobacillus raoultii TaxID=1987503 RepID=A0ABW3PFM1_9LACO|nr:helix-turn-helix transcriptional regulator [Lentilactobacillus raoultii]